MSHRWALRSLEEFNRTDNHTQALYGIIQGGIHQDLREMSTDFVNTHDFFGHAIGGSLGADKSQMDDVVAFTAEKLSTDRPIHLLGIGGIRDIFAGVKQGIDTFDCVHPTRLARHGGALIKPHEWEGLSPHPKEHLNLRNAHFALDKRPISQDCPCETCANFSRGYLHHLLKAKELLALQAISLHNIAFMNQLMGFLAYVPQLDDEELECYKEDTFEDLHCIGKTLANLYIKSSLIHRDLHYNNIFVYIDPNEAGVVSVTLIDYADLSELDENRLPHEDVHKLLYHSHELMSHCQSDPLFEGAFQQLEDGYNLAFSEAGLSWKRATAQVKFGESFPSLSAVEFDKYTLLAKKKTFANDPILPTRLMRSAKFMCENDFGRQPRYVNIVKVERKGEEDFDAPPSRAIYIIGNVDASLTMRRPLTLAFDDDNPPPPPPTTNTNHFMEAPNEQEEIIFNNQESAPSHIIRISAQVRSQEVYNIFQHCEILLPNCQRVPPNFENAENGRIPILEDFPVDEFETVSFILVGKAYSPYSRCLEPVLFRRVIEGKKDELFQNLPTMRLSNGKPLCAIRLNFEIRELRYDDLGKKFPLFLRITGRYKYGEKSRTLSPVSFGEFTTLPPKDTFGYTPHILEQVRSRFVRESNRDRRSTYVNEDDDSPDSMEEHETKGFNSLSIHQTLAISTYVLQAMDIYRDLTPEDWHGFLTLFVHFDLINRRQVEDTKTLCKERYSASFE
ncbi:putative queuine tRNA-ribosyltransferase [Stylophora pistillata]|uniref:Putative queuine tRNA-ribosyltransferase n=1 Tax=Stylophora pistillata TaxID=50429 RepID=A0A2B4QYK6_STYPI|nr:putative queuine tRNA-ribosyltransferase [Stylophora pistillata]